MYDGTSGQDRKNYTDTQDRDSYDVTNAELYLPGDNYQDGQVVASVWVNDTAEPPQALLLTLQPTAPYYRVIDIEWHDGDWHSGTFTEHDNIIDAVAEYANRGGN